MRILMIEDDKELCRAVQAYLMANGVDADLCHDGEEGLYYLRQNIYDMCCLDRMLPGMDGLSLLKQARTDGVATPVLMLTALSRIGDRVDGLEAGADDYLTKPFSVEELLARLRVALRRVRYDSQKTSTEASAYENGELKIDYAAGCVYRGGEEIHLTPIEYKLLCVLAKNTGKVLTHNYIFNEVWGSPTASDTPSLRVFMATLRKKLERDPGHPQYIQTHIGVGYRMIRQKPADESV